MSQDLIVTDPGIALGKPVVRGTRLTVESCSKSSALVNRCKTCCERTRA